MPSSKRPRHAARANAVRNGSKASSQKASGSLLRIARVSATPPGARPSVRPDVITWAVGQWRIRASWRESKAINALSSPNGDARQTPNAAIGCASDAKACARDCRVVGPRIVLERIEQPGQFREQSLVRVL